MANHTLKTPWFNGDSRHIATPLHKALGDMVIAFLQEQRCLLDDADITLPGDSKGLFVGADLVGEVPPVRHTVYKHATAPADAPVPTAPHAGQVGRNRRAPLCPANLSHRRLDSRARFTQPELVDLLVPRSQDLPRDDGRRPHHRL